ncbi:MAG TPA: response regulator transcription factor [Baekduia sp.]|nr:response regulator transcription factor [Baekduia sp.]
MDPGLSPVRSHGAPAGAVARRGVLLLDDGGDVVGHDAAAWALLGQAGATTGSDVLPALGFEGDGGAALDAARAGAVVARQAWCDGADHRCRWCESTLSVMVDGVGGFVVVVEDITHHLIEPQSTGDAPEVQALLSPRQYEILGLIAEGLGNAEIARRVFLSEATVKWHVRQILQKLGAPNRAGAVARYLRTEQPG